jgi:hypothetical protein
MRWPWNRNKPIQSLSSEALMQVCDSYFLTAEELVAVAEGNYQERDRSYTRYGLAIDELFNRGTEIREWARRLLAHVDYDAREAGANLLGHLAERKRLGDFEEQIVVELGLLIQRLVEEDGKEMQAVDAALLALGKTGNPSAIPYISGILFSTQPEHQGDTQWIATEVLSELVKEPFMTSNDPIESARQWLLAHPDN